jgi:DNA-binding response OmpR family regulator
MKILLIDDDQEFTSFLKMELEDMGHPTDTAFNGFVGENKALINPYDLIILDLMLPGQDGHSICKRLREKHFGIPILMISSLDSKEEKSLGFSEGINDFMTKPFSFDDLYNKIICLDNEYHGKS